MIHDSIMLNIIVAIDEKRGIGRSSNAANQGMLWHISEDFKRFKALTSGHPIIMGRTTQEMIGRALPNRTNIVVTRDVTKTIEGCIIASSFEDAIEKAKKCEGSDELFVIGGGQIFAQALPIAEKLYLTLVRGDYEADIFFPEYEKAFPVIESEETKIEGDYTFTFQNRLQKAK